MRIELLLPSNHSTKTISYPFKEEGISRNWTTANQNLTSNHHNQNATNQQPLALKPTDDPLHTSPDDKKRYIYQTETTPHIATIISFPSHASTTPSLHTKTCLEMISLATTVALFEPVRLYVRPEDKSRAQDLLNQALESVSASQTQRARTSLIPAPTNHVWVRDTGPVYVRGVEDGKRYAIDFGFCEWGINAGSRSITTVGIKLVRLVILLLVLSLVLDLDLDLDLDLEPRIQVPQIGR